ncbi:MAG: hypothetical protein LBC53_00595 [Spirochaetaceae bacterium]|nr:hypothetical protein [Spirochaetaceae bacterium]
MAIPKKIHYCWLSGEKMPRDIVISMNSWKKVMPDYEFVLWDKNRFDIDSVPWVREWCAIKKWALAADYIRLFAVYTEGGIYLDTDVYALKPFDDFLQYDYFTGFEYESKTSIFENVVNSDWDDIQRVGEITFEAAVFGAVKGHPFLRDCMKWYENHHYEEIYQKIVAPDIYAAVAQKYGFKYKYSAQKLNNNIVILPAGVFANLNVNIGEETYAVHWCAGLWKDVNKPSLANKVKNNSIVRKMFGKEPFLRIDKRIQAALKNGKQGNS